MICDTESLDTEMRTPLGQGSVGPGRSQRAGWGHTHGPGVQSGKHGGGRSRDLGQAASRVEPWDLQVDLTPETHLQLSLRSPLDPLRGLNRSNRPTTATEGGQTPFRPHEFRL